MVHIAVARDGGGLDPSVWLHAGTWLPNLGYALLPSGPSLAGEPLPTSLLVETEAFDIIDEMLPAMARYSINPRFDAMQVFRQASGLHRSTGKSAHVWLGLADGRFIPHVGLGVDGRPESGLEVGGRLVYIGHVPQVIDLQELNEISDRLLAAEIDWSTASKRHYDNPTDESRVALDAAIWVLDRIIDPYLEVISVITGNPSSFFRSAYKKAAPGAAIRHLYIGGDVGADHKRPSQILKEILERGTFSASRFTDDRHDYFRQITHAPEYYFLVERSAVEKESERLHLNAPLPRRDAKEAGEGVPAQASRFTDEDDALNADPDAAGKHSDTSSSAAWPTMKASPKKGGKVTFLPAKQSEQEGGGFGGSGGKSSRDVASKEGARLRLLGRIAKESARIDWIEVAQAKLRLRRVTAGAALTALRAEYRRQFGSLDESALSEVEVSLSDLDIDPSPHLYVDRDDETHL